MQLCVSTSYLDIIDMFAIQMYNEYFRNLIVKNKNNFIVRYLTYIISN